MELENHSSKQAYIQLLAETLQKKSGVLNQLMNLTLQQEKLIMSDDFGEDEFQKLITLKEEQIGELAKLDQGFERLYESVKTELTEKKYNYEAQINLLKELITHITDLNVKLQALEQRNKSRLEVIFAKRRKDIKSARISSRTATNYYKTMSGQHEIPSFFYDKKN